MWRYDKPVAAIVRPHAYICMQATHSTQSGCRSVQFIKLCAKFSGAVYCNRSCLWGYVRVCGWVGLLPRYLEIAFIDLHQTGSVGEGSDHFQLIKLWPSCTPGKGVCSGAKFFGSALLQPARSVCISLSALFIILILNHSCWRHDSRGNVAA